MAILEIGIGWLVLLLLIGLAAGVLGGLLGVGGGIVTVPALFYGLALIDMDAGLRMHVAVGTSLACVIVTSIRSARSHHARGAVDVDLLRRWAPATITGTLIGAVVAARVGAGPLIGVFAAVATLVAIQLGFVPQPAQPRRIAVPRGLAGAAIAVCIGILSTLMGIGGGSLSVPVLHYWGFEMHRAVGTAAGLGLVIAVPATLGLVAGGWQRAGLPEGALGFVYVPGLLLIAPGSWLGAPLGARLAHALPGRLLRRGFAIFLLLTVLRMAAELA